MNAKPDIIEVTRINVSPAGNSGPVKRLIGRAHIVSIAPGDRDTALILLSSGEKFNVVESYNQLKRMLGIDPG